MQKSNPSIVTLTGHIIVSADDLATVNEALPMHINATLAEPGCISFSVTPDPDDPYRFNVSEAFVDQTAFEAHQQRVKASDWGKITANVERHYEVQGIDG